MDIVTRAEWGARRPKSRKTIGLPTSELWLHHYATDGWRGAAGMRACQDFHMDSRGWSDIAYSFCVDMDGSVFEGRGVGIAGAHTSGHNSISHAICWMANTDRTKPSKAMIQATAQLAAHGRSHGWWGEWTGGHKQASGASTACPGRHGMAALPDLRALTASYLNDSPDQEDTMSLTDDDIDRIASRVWGRQVHFIGADRQPATLVMRDIATHARRAASALDPDDLAARIVARIDAPDVTVEIVADGVRQVFAELGDDG